MRLVLRASCGRHGALSWRLGLVLGAAWGVLEAVARRFGVSEGRLRGHPEAWTLLSGVL